MPICIECSCPVPQLYQRLSSKKTANATAKDDGFRGGGEAKKAKSNASSADVRLMQCPNCKRFADKYVEHDFVVLFIDLVLVKPQVYRHLLFNNDRLIATNSAGFTPAIKRLGTLLVLFDVYLTWSAIELMPPELTASSTIPRLPILAQYLFYLVLCAITTSTQHIVIRELAQWRWFRGTSTCGNISMPPGSLSNPSLPMSPVGNSPKKSRIQQGNAYSALSPGMGSPPPSRPPSASSLYNSQSPTSSSAPISQMKIPLPPPRRNAVSTALLVSSCTKLFPILMVVWKYEDKTGQLTTGVNWAVAIQNVEASRILLGSGYGAAAVLVAVGWLSSWLVSRAVLIAVGLGGM